MIFVEANRIAPRLHQGSAPPYGHVLYDAGFDLLVLCAEEHQPDALLFPGVEVVHCPMDDADRPPNNEELDYASTAAARAADVVRAGGRALITCWAGKNRSGFVMVLTLHNLTGRSGQSCIRRVRVGRPIALENAHFVAMLEQIPRAKRSE